MHAPPIHSVPLSMPFQQHQVNGMPAQYMHSLPVDTSAGNNQFNEPCSSTASDGNHVLPVSKDDASRFPDELGLVEPASSTQCVPTSRHARGTDMKVSKSSVSSARNTGEDISEAGGIGTTSSNNDGPTMGPSLKPQAPHQPTSSGQQYLHPIGYSDQRGGGASQKTGSGGEWQRRMGYQGRSRTSGPDKNLASSKVKKVYVAKSPTRGTVATG